VKKMNSLFTCAAAFVLFAAAGPARADEAWTVDAGPLVLEITVSSTANLFHAVDQIAQWSEYCHDQYVPYFNPLGLGLSAEDRKALSEHSSLRERKGWGQGLEQTFYTAADLETALKEGIRAGFITPADADVERRVLSRFKARVDRLMSDQARTLRGFARNVMDRRKELESFAGTFGRFVGSGKMTVPMFLMANPSENSFGGGFNGGRLTLEIPSRADAYPMLLHELVHAYIRTKDAAIEAAARGTAGLNGETLSEGLAYAYNPGIVHAADSDPLMNTVREYMARGSTLKDSYTRFSMYGLALRKLLEPALSDEKQSLETFLPRAVDAWTVLFELEAARTGEKP
jgi:hypothetical protein